MDDEQLDQPKSVTNAAQGYRMNAKGALAELIRRREYKTRNLRVVQALLPTELTQEQDEALWSLINELRE